MTYLFPFKSDNILYFSEKQDVCIYLEQNQPFFFFFIISDTVRTCVPPPGFEPLRSNWRKQSRIITGEKGTIP